MKGSYNYFIRQRIFGGYKNIVTRPYDLCLYRYIVRNGHTIRECLKRIRINVRQDAYFETYNREIAELKELQAADVLKSGKTPQNTRRAIIKKPRYIYTFKRVANLNPDAWIVEKWKLVLYVDDFTMYHIVYERAGLEQE